MKSTLHSDIANFVIKPLKFSILCFKSLLFSIQLFLSLSILYLYRAIVAMLNDLIITCIDVELSS